VSSRFHESALKAQALIKENEKSGWVVVESQTCVFWISIVAKKRIVKSYALALDKQRQPYSIVLTCWRWD